MKLTEFRQSLHHPEPPPGLPSLVEALWWDARGDWNRAHQIAQEIDSREAAWVHAYLHRKEGDISNAGYWYAQAGKSSSRQPLEAEWEHIVETLLAEGAASPSPSRNA